MALIKAFCVAIFTLASVHAMAVDTVTGSYTLMSGHVLCSNLIAAQIKEKENKKMLIVTSSRANKTLEFNLEAVKSLGRSEKGCRQFQRQVYESPNGFVMQQYSRSADECDMIAYTHWQKEASVISRPGTLSLEYLKEAQSRFVVSCQYKVN